MKRTLLVAMLAAAAFGTAAPATAGPGGTCDGTVDVACQEYPCEPQTPCTIQICLVWVKGDCLTN